MPDLAYIAAFNTNIDTLFDIYTYTIAEFHHLYTLGHLTNSCNTMTRQISNYKFSFNICTDTAQAHPKPWLAKFYHP